STAYTTASVLALAKANARAPDPVQRSTSTGCCLPATALTPHSSNSSVSGRGTNTPGPTRSVTSPNPAQPSRCCNGIRLARRCASLPTASTTFGSTNGTNGSLPRSTLSTCAAI